MACGWWRLLSFPSGSRTSDEARQWGVTAAISLWVKHGTESGYDNMIWCKFPLGSIAQTEGPKAQPREEDWLNYLRAMEAASALLIGGHSVVIHCMVGFHRTGVVGYGVLRKVGSTPEAAVQLMREVCEPTYMEMIAHTKNRPRGSFTKAEWMFGLTFGAARPRWTEALLSRFESEREAADVSNQWEDDDENFFLDLGNIGPARLRRALGLCPRATYALPCTST